MILRQSLAIGALLSVSAQATFESTRAWTDPAWSFSNETTSELAMPPEGQERVVNERIETSSELENVAGDGTEFSVNKKIATSLIFDQDFDRAEVRPYPQDAQENLAINEVQKSGITKDWSRFGAALVQEQSVVNATGVQVVNRQTVPRIPYMQPRTSPPIADPEKIVEQKPAPVSNEVAEKPLIIREPKSEIKKESAPVKKSPWKPSPAETDKAKVVVIDAESLDLGEARPVSGAKLTWIGEASRIESFSNSEGLALAPYANSHSIRFVAEAEGYLPALGYVGNGLVSPIALVRAQKLAPTLQSLGVVPDPNRKIVFGKILGDNLVPAEGIIVDATVSDPFKVFYSIGGFSVFHPQAKTSGKTGDFFLSGLAEGIQYLMPSLGPNFGSEVQDRPSAVIDVGFGGGVRSVTLGRNQKTSSARFQVVDAFSLERPDATGIRVTVGGQRGLSVPDAEGWVEIEKMHPRSFVDLIEIQANGYLPTWLNSILGGADLPELVSLFTSRQISDLHSEVQTKILASRGFVLGNLAIDKFNFPVKIKVFGSDGRRNNEAKVFYFSAKTNMPSDGLEVSDPKIGNFSIANLAAGEWHVVVIDPKSGHGIGSHVVRTHPDTISQIQF